VNFFGGREGGFFLIKNPVCVAVSDFINSENALARHKSFSQNQRAGPVAQEAALDFFGDPNRGQFS